MKVFVCEMGAHTRENPWCVVNEQSPKGFGVVSLETFDNEFDRLIFLLTVSRRIEIDLST